jgi:hypothetical protein
VEPLHDGALPEAFAMIHSAAIESEMTKMTAIKHKIRPHLWFDQEAKKGGEFYTSVFPDPKSPTSPRFTVRLRVIAT